MQPGTENVALTPGEAHVWRASLDLPAARLDEIAVCLSEEELARAARFHFERDGNRYIAGRGLLRHRLAGYLRADPAALRFSYGAQGKPFLVRNSGASDIAFNLSHSAGVALYAFSMGMKPGMELGIDIERLDPTIDVDNIAGSFFSPREVLAIRALPPDRRHVLFFDFWTRKEAYLKTLGHGLSIPLNEFDVSSLSEIDHAGFPKCWVYPLAEIPGHAAALVANRPLVKIDSFALPKA